MVLASLIVLVTAAMGQTSNLTHEATLTDGLQYPGRLAPTPAGGLYVTDPPNGQVLEYDAAGALVGPYLVPSGPLGVAAHPTSGNNLRFSP